jgi:hypothetical protein
MRFPIIECACILQSGRLPRPPIVLSCKFGLQRRCNCRRGFPFGIALASERYRVLIPATSSSGERSNASTPLFP